MMELEADSAGPLADTAEDDFRELFDRHYAGVVRKVMILVKEQSVAEDIAQEVFVKLYFADRTAIDHLPGWLTKVAVNTAYNHIRTEKRHHARGTKQAAYDREPAGSAEEKYMKLDDIRRVQETLRKLPERDRELLILKFSGYSYAEIAKSTGLEPASIGTMLVRAKARFRKIYLEERTETE